MKYPILLLDVDDTLLDFHASESRAIRDVLTARGLPAGPEELACYSRINRGWWERFERGECRREELLWQRFADYFAQAGSDADPRQAQRDYGQALGSYGIWLPGAEALCRRLRESGRRLYAVTNGNADVQHRRLASTGLGALLDGVFISEEVGSQKPDPAYFQRVFAALGDPRREDCLLVGDSQTSDMQGGRSAGVAVCWYNPHGKQPIGRWDYTLTRLEELLEVLK